MARFSSKSIAFIRRPPEHDADVNILSGSVRSGKTYSVVAKTVLALNRYPVDGLRIIFGVSKQSVKRNFLGPLRDFVGAKAYKFNNASGELWIQGVPWHVLGAADAGTEDPLQGLTGGIAVGDELSKISPDFFNMLLSRFSTNGGRIYGTTNPDSPYHWLKTEFLDNQALLDSGALWHESFTLDDNLSLSPAVRAKYDRMYTGVFKKRFIDGLWVLAEGAIYKDSFDDANLYDDSTRPALLLDSHSGGTHCIAIDYGTSNACVFLDIVDDGETFWVERERYYDSRNFQETGGRQLTDKEHIDALEEFTKDINWSPAIVDPSAASLKAEMTFRGIPHQDADNDVVNGIRMVSSLLSQKKLRIHRRCKHLCAELQSYSWDARAQKNGEDKPLKQFDHACDALRYFVKTAVSEYRVTY